ncbi:MAG: ABC transporter permease subunit [Anaerolineae bacterium]|jgi:ABC-2 type transport system permease protein|nr:ABC transporter permease subunit [Anaerolineae bacterium]
MLGEIWAIIVKEWKMLFLSRGNRRNNGWYSIVVAIGLIGIYMPVLTKEAWITDPTSMIMWAWMPIFWSLGIITSAIAGEREAHTLETLLASRLSDSAILIGKMLSAVLYGWGLMFISTLVGVIVVNIAFIEGPFQFYKVDVFLAAQLAIFLMATMFSAIGVLVSLKAPTARQAYQRLSIVMLILYIGPMMIVSFLPDELIVQWIARFEGVTLNWDVLVPAALAVLLLIDVGLFLVAKVRFQRTKLILA